MESGQAEQIKGRQSETTGQVISAAFPCDVQFETARRDAVNRAFKVRACNRLCCLGPAVATPNAAPPSVSPAHLVRRSLDRSGGSTEDKGGRLC